MLGFKVSQATVSRYLATVHDRHQQQTDYGSREVLSEELETRDVETSALV
jgi:hypothetical protein